MKELKENLKVYLKENKTTEINYDQLRNLYIAHYPGSIIDNMLKNFIKHLIEKGEVETKNSKKTLYIFKPSFFTNIEINKQLRRKFKRPILQRR